MIGGPDCHSRIASKGWMSMMRMCENVYQSVMCCEFSELCTTPCQSFTYPQAQIGSRPIANRIEACRAIRPAANSHHCLIEKPVAAVVLRSSVMGCGSSAGRGHRAFLPCGPFQILLSDRHGPRD